MPGRRKEKYGSWLVIALAMTRRVLSGLKKVHWGRWEGCRRPNKPISPIQPAPPAGSTEVVHHPLLRVVGSSEVDGGKNI